MEIFMRYKPFSLLVMLIAISTVLSTCNLPERQVKQTETPTATASEIDGNLPPSDSMCANEYFPNQVGNKWEYSGSNSATGNYTRSDMVSVASADSFTVTTTWGNTPYSVTYTCSANGLTATNPIQQYVGAIISKPDSPVQIQLISNSGTSLPVSISPGDTWQQIAEGNASSVDFNLDGRFVFDFSAVGYEDVTVPSGTYHALRVNTTIRIEVSGFHILAGTYQLTTWLVANIGMVKSEGASHVPGVDFTDQLQLTQFTPSP
jgi:hypothetical protein